MDEILIASIAAASTVCMEVLKNLSPSIGDLNRQGKTIAAMACGVAAAFVMQVKDPTLFPAAIDALVYGLLGGISSTGAYSFVSRIAEKNSAVSVLKMSDGGEEPLNT